MMNSSRRFKTRIGNLESGETIRKLRPVRFMNQEYKPDFGLIAEEVVDVFSEAVTLDQSGEPFSVDYAKLVAPLIDALNAVTARLEARIDVIEKKLAHVT